MIVDTSERGTGRGYWHQMGETYADPSIPATVAAEQAGMNYVVEKRPLSTIDSKGNPIEFSDTFAVVSTYKGVENAIAVVGSQFEPVQNMHLAEMLDAAHLTGPQGLYGIDVAGITRDGRTAFWALRSHNPDMIAGDEYRDHWLLTDGKDGHRALTLALTPIRTVCSNAIAMAVAGAAIKIGIPHTKNASDELAFWLGIAPKLRDASTKSKKTLERMATITVTSRDVETVLNAAYPTPQVRGRAQLFAELETLKLDTNHSQLVERAATAHDVESARVVARRQLVRDLFVSYASNPEEKNVAGTLLGVVNAVADVENHREPSSVREDVALSNLYGPRFTAQKKAITSALTLMR